MGESSRKLSGVTLLAALTLSLPAAADVTFTDCTAFLSAAGGLEQGTLDWEGIASGTPLTTAGLTQVALPTTIGITFPTSIPDVMGGSALGLAIAGLTSPGSHVLGTDDVANYHSILGGTAIDLDFTEPVGGICIEVISADLPGSTLRSGDLELELGSTVATLDVSQRTLLGTANLVGGGGQDVYAYHLGVMTDSPFGSAGLRSSVSVPNGGFNYVIDEIAVVPEPSPGAGLLSGAASLWLLSRSRRRATKERRR